MIRFQVPREVQVRLGLRAYYDGLSIAEAILAAIDEWASEYNVSRAGRTALADHAQVFVSELEAALDRGEDLAVALEGLGGPIQVPQDPLNGVAGYVGDQTA